MRASFDVVLFDPATTAITHDVLATSLRERGQAPPIVIINNDDDVGALVAAKLRQRRS